MNPLRKFVHKTLEVSGLDRRIDADKVNRSIELRRARKHAILSAAAANQHILELLREGKPAAIGKLGSSECWALAWHLGLKRFYKYTWAPPSFGELDLAEQSGVFPNDEPTFHRFCAAYLERLQLFDCLAVWHNTGESQILSRFCPAASRLALRSLEPYFFDQPWTAGLAGKRVLVVHPFEPSIRSQFERRHLLWPANPAVLPGFELEVVRSPYGFSKTNFPEWLAMLSWLEQKVDEVHARKPIDVALIGCGAAGVPLAAHVKKLGGIGIHTGGATQLFFGIRGGRWDRMPEFQKFFTDAWVRPQPDETPKEAPKVDKGGYW